MHVCKVCNRTYHWLCFKNFLNTGCYTERQRKEVDKNGNWACPGCAHLNDEQKQKRYSESINTKLIHVTWEPTWEPEELRDTLPNLLECVQDFVTRVDEPDLFLPTADYIVDNLERQGFDMSNKANSWIPKLDTDLRNKVSFDVHPTNPQADIQPTESCEFWIRNVELVRFKPKPTTCSTEQPPPQHKSSTSYSSRNLLIKSSMYLQHRQKMPGHDDTGTYQHLNTAFHTAKLKGLNKNKTPAPENFASCITPAPKKTLHSSGC